MNYISAYVLSGLGTIIVGFWLVIYVKYHNAYDDMLMALDSNQFMLPDISIYRQIEGEKRKKNLQKYMVRDMHHFIIFV